jgi:hypothetical protein
MEITVKITQQMIKQVEQEVQEFTGRKPTQKQIEKFFRGDIKFMYFSQFEDGLADSVEAHFG